MRTVTFLTVILSLFVAVSCGDKDKKKNSNNLPVYNQFQTGQQMIPRTEEGTFNVQSGLISIGGRSYQAPSQLNPQSQSMQYLQQFFYMVQQNPTAYRMVSQSVYRVRITGYLVQTGSPQMPYLLTITAPLQPY